jgi:hypothetical protein
MVCPIYIALICCLLHYERNFLHPTVSKHFIFKCLIIVGLTDDIWCFCCGLVVGDPGYRSRGPGFDFQRYQIFWEVVGLERGPLSLVSTIEERLGRNSSSSGLQNREYGRGDPLRWLRDTLYPQKLALTSPICGGRSVGIVYLRTKTTEFIFLHTHTWQEI